MIALAESQRLPMTWAVSDPAHSAATSLILQSAIDHELAILGDANWIGPTAGRTRFARELVRRVSQARATGLEVTSLVPTSLPSSGTSISWLSNRLQRSPASNCPSRADSCPPRGPCTTACGSCRFRHDCRCSLSQSSAASGRRGGGFDGRCAKHDVSLVIDAPTVLACGSSAEKMICWIARRIALLRDRGFISVETMRSMAACLAHVPAVRPQRSILRAAA